MAIETYGISSEYAKTNYFLSPEKQQHLNSLYRRSGQGNYDQQYCDYFSKLDRSQIQLIQQNHESAEITLITRPRLNLGSSNIRANEYLSMLDVYNPESTGFAIRALLDTKFALKNNHLCARSPLIEHRNPFLTPLCNSLVGISGFPDMTLSTNTTQQGFHQEDQTYVRGGLGLEKSTDLTLTFRDPQGGPVLSILQVWLVWMAAIRTGRLVMYSDDIDENRMPYTVSIYRINLDPTQRIITNWMKCTGCFPKSVPLGSIMTVNENERYVGAAGKYSVPFTCNVVEYNTPGALKDLLALLRRYYPNIDNQPYLQQGIEYNKDGLPWLHPHPMGIQYLQKSLGYELVS